MFLKKSGINFEVAPSLYPVGRKENKPMKRIALALVACTALSLPANAQGYGNFPSFQHWNLNTMTVDEQARINAGVRNGSLTHQEAAKLQNQLNRINELKARMSRNGLSLSERQKIDRELDKLAENIYRQSRDGHSSRWLGSNPYSWARTFRHGNQNFNYGNLNTADEQARINAGLRNGTLTRAEASRLQNQLNEINNLKARLSRGGLSRTEHARISAKIDQLNDQIRRETRDRQIGSGRYNGRWR